MTEPTYLSKSAFAARLGRSPSYITWLKDNNRLVLSPNGKQVDVHATEALIRDTADPSKVAVAERHQQDRIQRDVYSQLSTQTEPTSTAAPPQVLTGDGKQPDFQKARALREHNMAKLAEIELGKAQGSLVSKEAVQQSELENLCNRIFAGSSKDMILSFLSREDLSEAELAEIKEAVKEFHR